MSRLEWILTGILVALLLAAAGLGWLWWQQTQRPPTHIEAPTNNVVNDAPGAFQAIQPARAAYELAAARAAEWAADAQLISASGDWAVDRSLAASVGGWGFVFYSAQNGRQALITVAGEQITFIGVAQASGAERPIILEEWLIDSDEMLEIILTSGGQLFLEENETVSLYLKIENDPPLSWKSDLRNQQSGERLTVWVNAENGGVLLLEERP